MFEDVRSLIQKPIEGWGQRDTGAPVPLVFLQQDPAGGAGVEFVKCFEALLLACSPGFLRRRRLRRMLTCCGVLESA